MAKRSGLGMRLFVAGYNLGGDIGAIDKIAGGPAALDVTSIEVEAFERIGGLRDGGIDFTSWFNTDANRAHARFSALPTGHLTVAALIGTAIGDPVACEVAKQVNYDGKRGGDGAMSFAVATQISDGTSLEWCLQATPGIRTDTAATNGAPLDGAAASAFGLAAYLHVFSFTGTSVTVKLQESSDNAGDAYADVVGGGFTTATGITSQRIVTSRSLAVERYLRVVTTGTFSNAQFAVAVHRYPLAEGL